MTTIIKSTSYLADIIKTGKHFDIEWNKIQNSPYQKKTKTVDIEYRCPINLLRLFFSKTSKEEEKKCNLKDFNLGIKAYLNADGKIRILEIPEEILMCQLVEIDGLEFGYTPLSLESCYDQSIDALSIRLISSSNLPKGVYEHTIPALDEGYGSDILFHTDKMGKIYSIEVLFASHFLDLNFK